MLWGEVDDQDGRGGVAGDGQEVPDRVIRIDSSAHARADDSDQSAEIIVEI